MHLLRSLAAMVLVCPKDVMLPALAADKLGNKAPRNTEEQAVCRESSIKDAPSRNGLRKATPCGNNGIG